MCITTLMMDLATNVFLLCRVHAPERAVLSQRVKRSQPLDAVASLPPSVIGMETCGSAQHWNL
jgi:transposase